MKYISFTCYLKNSRRFPCLETFDVSHISHPNCYKFHDLMIRITINNFLMQVLRSFYLTGQCGPFFTFNTWTFFNEQRFQKRVHIKREEWRAPERKGVESTTQISKHSNIASFGHRYLVFGIKSEGPIDNTRRSPDSLTSALVSS